MKKIDVTRDGKRVYTELYVPEGDSGAYPVIILSHGFTAYGGSQAHLAKPLNDAGIALCLFDFCGGGFESRSEGSSREMSVLTEVEDLRVVYNAVVGEEGIDPDKVFLMGNSQGGFVSSLLAAQLEENLRGLILNFPAFVIPEDTRKRYPDREAIPEESTVFDFPLGAVYHRDAWGIDVYGEIGKFRKPVLLVHGDQDDIVPIGFSERAVETYENARLHVIPGAGHGYNREQDEELLNVTVEYIREQLS